MSEAKELTEIYYLQRNGANIIEVWEFVLSSPRHRTAYEKHHLQGKIATHMWEFLPEKLFLACNKFYKMIAL